MNKLIKDLNPMILSLRWLFITMIFGITIIGIESCDEKLPDYATPYFKGNHELRKFNEHTSKESSWHGSYFLIVGSAGGESHEESKIAFSWKNNDGQYLYSKIDLDRVRLKFDSTIVTPYITFGIYDDRYQNAIDPDVDTQRAVEGNVAYIVVHCRPEDYVKDVNLNQLK